MGDDATKYAGKVFLVTGGSGLVGQAVHDYVNSESQFSSSKWIFLSSKDADLCSYDATSAVFELHKPTHVLHLAAFVGGLYRNLKYKVDMYRKNQQMNDNVMECCRVFKVEKLVSCLSTCVFPDKTSYPINETMLHNGAPHLSNEGYAYAKRMIDVMNRCYRDQHGCNFTSVIPTNIYGPYDNFSIENGHVIPGLIHKCYLAKKNNTEYSIWGSGKPLRQFIFNRDLAKLMVWTLLSYEDTDPIILSPPESQEVSIESIARKIAQVMDFQGEIVFDTTKSDGQFKKTADNTKLMAALPDFKFTPFEEGIREATEWFCANYETARK